MIGAYLYIRHLQWLQRPALERIVEEGVQIIKQSLLFIVEVTTRIQKAESWKGTGARTWNDYLKNKWGFGDSRLSQLRSVAPHLRALLSAGESEKHLEAHLRKLKKVVEVDNPLMVAAYGLGNLVASQTGKAPTEAVYKRSLEVLQEADRTGGTVQVGEETYLVKDKESAALAVRGVLAEVQKTALSGNKTLTEIIATRNADGTWDVRALNGSSILPSRIKAKVYI